MAVVDPPMVDVLIDLRLTRFFFLDTGNWPRSLDRVDAAYGRMKHRDAKPRKIWTDPESRTVQYGYRTLSKLMKIFSRNLATAKL